MPRPLSKLTRRIRIRITDPACPIGATFDIRWQQCGKLLCQCRDPKFLHGPFVYLQMSRKMPFPAPPRAKRQARRYIRCGDPLYYAVLRAAGVEAPRPMPGPALLYGARMDAALEAFFSQMILRARARARKSTLKI